jgi:N-acetylmuramoyl-L-alanine amidase
MLVGKWFLFCGIFLILFAQVGLAATTQSLSVSMEGQSLGPEYGIVSETQTKYINVSFLRKFFLIATSWNSSAKELYFKFGKLNYKLYAGNNSFSINGNIRKLSAAPYVKDGQLWIPLDFYLELGLRIKESNDGNLALEWAENYLLGIEKISYHNRPAFLLTAAKNFPIKDYVLHSPERLVFELPLKKHFALGSSVSISQPPVKQVRIKENVAGKGMIVFDLDKHLGYSIIRNPNQPNQAIITFNYQIEDVLVSQSAEDPKIAVKTSQASEFKTERHPETNTLELIFSGAVYQNEPKTLPGDGVLARSVQIAPHDDNTVSIIVELASEAECVALRSRKNPQLIEIKRVGKVNEITWNKSPTGGALNIISDGELREDVRTTVIDLKHLQIDLESTQFTTQLGNSIPCDGLLKSINLLNSDPHTAALDIEFSSLAVYNIEFSANRHQMTVHIDKSSLSGKTIVLDPGHGGLDTGACGKLDTYEKEINFAVAMRLKVLLEQAGANVILTRTNDTFIGLYERCYLANHLRADIFISIHANSHPNPNIHGIEIFHYPQSVLAHQLAVSVLDKITFMTGLQNLGVKTNNFVVIRETEMPSILVELGFLSNYSEERLLRTDRFKDNAAIGIFNGIISFF